MADTKISSLAAVTSVLSTDEFVLARAGTTKKIAASDLLLYDAYVHLRDQQAANTVGGTPVATTWTTRVLNTEVTDASAICSLSSNQFTLAAGVYRIFATAPFYVTGRAKIRLRNVTDSTTLLVGTSTRTADASDAPVVDSVLRGEFTVAASKALAIQYYVQGAAGGTRGLGVEVNSGEVEVYTEVELWRYA